MDLNDMKKQHNFFKMNPRKEHGGSLSYRKRRSKRILSIKNPLHLTLRSEFAYGARSLLKHQHLINHIAKKNSKRFGVKIYRQAICGNHIHLLLKGQSRIGLQNFFRVIAGHTAQGILKNYPIKPSEYHAQVIKKRSERKVANKSRGGALSMQKQGCLKNQRMFWDLLVYTRIVTWGREFMIVDRYVIQNTLEALNLIVYTSRKKRIIKNTS
jgi:REP element-mobilizing transposase RayT